MVSIGSGRSSDTLFAAHLNRVFGAIALNALEVYAVPTPWLHREATITLYGAYEEEARPVKGAGPHRRPMGIAKMGVMISSKCS